MLSVFTGRHRSTKPVISPREGAQRSTTVRTRPGVSGPRRAASSRWHATSVPSATTSTRPSVRLVAEPARPSSNARARTHQRNPTPCTWPCTQAVNRTLSGLPGSAVESAGTAGRVAGRGRPAATSGPGAAAAGSAGS
jgi:hypothetical protein